jgi:hypothetical protein
VVLYIFAKDNYLEEALKMRNLLEEFGQKHGLRTPTILGVREHVFTGRCCLLCTQPYDYYNPILNDGLI